MEKSYKTVLSYGYDEFIVNRSQFIGYCKPINSEEEALVFIDQIKERHKDATHNVFAYVYGKNSNVQRFNDDGEPSGTAGIPVLEVIKKEDLRNIVVVVTRYFGGIKLGGGGLIRAYTRGAKVGIDASKIVDMRLHQQISMEIDYTSYGKIENYMQNNDYAIDKISYEERVNIIMSIKNDNFDVFKKEIFDFTNGDAKIDILGEYYLPVIKGKTILK